MLITGLIIKKDDMANTRGSVTKQPFWFFMLFFLVHYGLFVAIQMGMFFAVSGIGDQYGITFFNFFSKWPSMLTNEAYIMLGVFIVSYGFRLTTDFILTGDYKTSSLGYLMFQPYGRIFIQQVTVILGSMFLSFGAGKIFILIFALIKIFFEVFIDFDLLIKKAAKGELKSSMKKSWLNKLICALASPPLGDLGGWVRRGVIHILLKVFPCQQPLFPLLHKPNLRQYLRSLPSGVHF